MTTAESALPCAAVFGVDGTGTEALIDSLLGSDASLQTSLSQPVPQRRWTIDTKYFVAEVELQVWTPPAAEPGDHPPEALICLFDPDQEESFAAVQEWVGRHRERLEQVEVRLCVGNHAAPLAVPPGQSAWDQGFMHSVWEWCLDHQFEPVRVCTADEDYDTALGDDESEPEGMRRVREALCSHMWPNLVRKPAEALRLPPASPLAAPEPPCSAATPSLAGTETNRIIKEGTSGHAERIDSGEETTGEEKEPGPGVTKANGEGAKQESGETNTGKPDEKDAVHETAGASPAESSLHSDHNSAPATRLPPPEPACPDDDDADEDFDEGMMGDMDDLLGKMRDARGNVGSMPDDVRRARAADMVMQLMGMMGAGSGSDDDD